VTKKSAADPALSRRHFLGAATGVAAGVPATHPARQWRSVGQETTVADASATETALIPKRLLGRTGVKVSCLGLGGWHVGAIKESRKAIALMHAAIDAGVTFFDNAWDYHDGRSEAVMGEALATEGRRDRVFLMTKNCARDYEGSKRHLEDSLKRLRTDYLDLWQFHEMNYDNDPEWILKRGAIQAALEAKKAGKVRFIGFTGHKDPSIHLRALALPVRWDTAQMPINVMDAHYRSFAKHVVPVCRRKGVGVIAMKSLGGGAPGAQFLARGGLGVSVKACVRYALSAPVSTVVLGIMNRAQLAEHVAIASAFKPLGKIEREALAKQVLSEAGDGRHELFKSTTLFDGPYHRRQHGFML